MANQYNAAGDVTAVVDTPAKAYEAYEQALARYDKAKLGLRQARRSDRVAARDLFHVTLFSEMPERVFRKLWREAGPAAFATFRQSRALRVGRPSSRCR